MRVNAITGTIDNWTPDYYNMFYGPGGVNSLAIQGNYVYIVGAYSPGLTRVGISSGSRSAWQPEIDDVYDSEGSVYDVLVTEDKLYVAGNYSFQRADGGFSYYAQFELPVEAANVPPAIQSSTSALPTDGVVLIDLTSLI